MRNMYDQAQQQYVVALAFFLARTLLEFYCLGWRVCHSTLFFGHTISDFYFLGSLTSSALVGVFVALLYPVHFITLALICLYSPP